MAELPPDPLRLIRPQWIRQVGRIKEHGDGSAGTKLPKDQYGVAVNGVSTADGVGQSDA